MNNTVLQIRVDEDLKNNANMVLEDIGLDLSTAIRMFLNKTVAVSGLPFEINNKRKRETAKNISISEEDLNMFMNTEKPIYDEKSADEYLMESRHDRTF